jgi:hypothetical protein
MKGMRNKTTAFVALIAASALIAAPTATGADTVKTTLKITELTPKGAAGTVSAKKSKCEKGRKVTLKFVGEYGDVTIGSTKTNSKGAWKLKEKISDRGIFYATAKKKGDCAAATSKDKRLR